MVKLILFMLLTTLFVSCQYRVHIVDDEELFIGNPHSMFKSSDQNYHQILDTNAVYVDIDDYYWALKFDSDGWLTLTDNLTTAGFKVAPKSTDRGRYFVKGNRLKIELFFPGDSFRESARHRSIWQGEVNGDTLKLKYVNGTHVFVKSHRYYFESGELKTHSSDDH